VLRPARFAKFAVSLATLAGPIWLSYFAIPGAFITENGQTSLPFVLLPISGRILDSYHDGNTLMGGIVVKGAAHPVRIGVVSISEFQTYQRLERTFTAPTERIWLGCYGGHFTTIVRMREDFYELDQLFAGAAFRRLTPNHVFSGAREQTCALPISADVW
jgi:hypothetical protein